MLAVSTVRRIEDTPGDVGTSADGAAVESSAIFFFKDSARLTREELRAYF